MASIKALYQKINPDTYVLYEPRDLQYLKIVTDSLSRYYPNFKPCTGTCEDFEKELNRCMSRQFEKIARSIPTSNLIRI